MASELLCYPGGTRLEIGTGPGPGTAASTEVLVWGRTAEERHVSDSQVRTYVLDTSVLLSDPWACTRFAEHEVVVPLVVISELEGKRHHQNWAGSPARRCACSTTCDWNTVGSISRFLLGHKVERCRLS
ncbi:hypothetical protein MAUB1S_02411 [Mycolicibacterium aubagnense]